MSRLMHVADWRDLMSEEFMYKSVMNRREALGALATAGIGVAGFAKPNIAHASGLIPIRMMDTPGRTPALKWFTLLRQRAFFAEKDWSWNSFHCSNNRPGRSIAAQ